jgi:acetyl esterase/lipase
MTLNQQLAEGVEIVRDVVYAQIGDRALAMDLYWHPGAGEPEPLVVWGHGGAWMSGDKTWMPPVSYLLDNGFAMASIDYRLSQEALFPAQIEDCKAAIRWLRANAARYNLNPDRVGAWGESAGGYLVALLKRSSSAGRSRRTRRRRARPTPSPTSRPSPRRFSSYTGHRTTWCRLGRASCCTVRWWRRASIRR